MDFFTFSCFSIILPTLSTVTSLKPSLIFLSLLTLVASAPVLAPIPIFLSSSVFIPATTITSLASSSLLLSSFALVALVLIVLSALILSPSPEV